MTSGWRKRGYGRVKPMNTTQTQVRSTNEALNIAIDYMNERLEEHDAKYQRHPTTEAERHNILADIETVKEALAQQPQNEVRGLPSNEQVEPTCWITPDGEGFRMRMTPPVNDVPLGWTPLFDHPPVPYVTPSRTAQLDNTEKLYEELRSIIDGGSESMTHDDAVQYLKDKLAQQNPQGVSNEQVEPVAYDVRCDNCGGDGYDPKNNNYYCSVCEGSRFVEKMLYTTPYVPEGRQQRKPLTNENPLLVFAKECVLGTYSETELADAAFRAIEAAHGITAREVEDSARSKT